MSETKKKKKTIGTETVVIPNWNNGDFLKNGQFSVKLCVEENPGADSESGREFLTEGVYCFFMTVKGRLLAENYSWRCEGGPFYEAGFCEEAAGMTESDESWWEAPDDLSTKKLGSETSRSTQAEKHFRQVNSGHV